MKASIAARDPQVAIKALKDGGVYRSGVQVSVGFFSDIFVPDYGMQQPSFYKSDSNEWLWKFGEDEMYLELDEPIRLRITDVK